MYNNKKSEQAALKIWIDKCIDREKDKYIFFCNEDENKYFIKR